MLTTLSQFKQNLWVGSCSAAIVFLPIASLALEIESVPNPRQVNGGWVTDMANILSDDTEAQINQMLSELEANNGTEIAVVTVLETTPSASPKAFATNLFNYWGIGKQGEDNGVLLLTSVGDRRVEIDTGYGIEEILPDAQVARIIETEIVPEFKTGNFDRGILAGTQALVQELETPEVAVSETIPESTPEPTPEPIPETPAQTPPETAQFDRPSPSPTPLQPQFSFPIPLWQLLGSAATLVGSIWFVKSKIDRRFLFLPAQGRSRLPKDPGLRRIGCETCKRPMKAVDDDRLGDFLTPAESVARQLGSVRFWGWQCPTCTLKSGSRDIQISSTVQNDGDFEECPTCNELTVTYQTQILKAPTWNLEGQSLRTLTCNCCNYHRKRRETIERKPLPKNALVLPPHGRSNSSNLRRFEKKAPVHCQNCRHPMVEISPDVLSARLRPPQQTARQLNSVDFVGWHCGECYPTSPSTFHLRGYINPFTSYEHCPRCQEKTMGRSSTIVRPPTYSNSGMRRITFECHHCHYTTHRHETVPRLVSSHGNPGAFGSSSSSGGSSSGSSGSSGSCGGGGGFGGGSSGGGGAGGGW
ncbi:MAG: TPM domain-containing protein [Cyanobacteriota bacterium]|nr:TPM domain-containing protein [Cyanobacteriota bacterium]